MKRQFRSFFAGMITTVLIAALALSVMAITGKTSIDVYPIDIMVNGEVFQPTNAQGKPVDVFTYKGTTYAPLRALAEAYGLEVGYDAEKKLATVSEPEATPEDNKMAFQYVPQNDDPAYADFMDMWDIELSGDGRWLFLESKELEATMKWWQSDDELVRYKHLKSFANELSKQFDNEPPTIIVLGSGALYNESFLHPYGQVIITGR